MTLGASVKALPARWGLCLLAALIVSARAEADPLATGQAIELPLFRLFVVLVFCIVVAVVAILVLRNFQGRAAAPLAARFRTLLGPAAARRIIVHESRHLSAHGDVCLIECDGRAYLVLLSTGAPLLLHKDENGVNKMGPVDA